MAAPDWQVLFCLNDPGATGNIQNEFMGKDALNTPSLVEVGHHLDDCASFSDIDSTSWRIQVDEKEEEDDETYITEVTDLSESMHGYQVEQHMVCQILNKGAW